MNHFDSIEFSTGNDATIKTGRNPDQGMNATLIAFRHNSKAVHRLALLNQQGTLSSYICIPMFLINPVANGVNNIRTIWVAVNANKNLSTTGAGQQVYRNSAAGLMEMFLTSTWNGISNPFNGLVISNAKVRHALIPADLTKSGSVDKIYEALVANVNLITEKQKDESLRAAAIKVEYKKYQETLKKGIEAGHLAPSQILIAEDIHPVFGLNASMSSANNPFCNFKAIAQKFGVTYAPTVNHCSGFITTSTENAPEASNLEVGRRPLDKGANPRCETSVMASATDGYGNSTEILVRVQDPAYKIKDGQTPRSQIFEELTETPTHMFVQGNLNAFVAETGKQGATHGQSLFGVTIDSYTLHTPPMSTQMHSNMSLNLTETDLGNLQESFEMQETFDEIIEESENLAEVSQSMI